MPYVRRNADGAIEAVFDQPQGSIYEEVPSDDPELLEFIGIDELPAATDDEWVRSDLVSFPLKDGSVVECFPAQTVTVARKRPEQESAD